ncbi:biliverdin-producing heme oxygenase [Rhabdobacter roseus]|uniref:Heme oxygenase n=1 Tax=Rhabdobacter roseus TaxID=1655419 RepID=A0A840TM56_9BACT|nr:biliverdin-producing heme oxygenase [Rhabdobacter roseus]MBB5282837.1 heme oxygenase [Rhabdobacter roseus]
MNHKLEKTTFLKQLKESTWEQHLALEQTELSQLLLSPTLGLEQYIHILYAFYGGFHPLESFLAEVLSLHKTAFRVEPRASLALEDIRYLSGTWEPGLLPNEIPQVPSQPATTPAALGTLYVLEGSRLGGKIISKQVSKSLGVTASEGGRFFAGTQGMESWKSFQENVESYVAQQPEAADDIIQSANDTFRRLRAYFILYYQLYLRQG